ARSQSYAKRFGRQREPWASLRADIFLDHVRVFHAVVVAAKLLPAADPSGRSVSDPAAADGTSTGRPHRIQAFSGRICSGEPGGASEHRCADTGVVAARRRMGMPPCPALSCLVRRHLADLDSRRQLRLVETLATARRYVFWPNRVFVQGLFLLVRAAGDGN